MKSKSLIHTPEVYKMPNVDKGDEVVVHILKPGQQFIQLTFEEKIDEENVYKPKAVINYEVRDLENKPQLKERIEEIKKKVVLLGGVYSSYNYLFAVCDCQPHLLSAGLSETAFGYSVVKTIGKKIDAPLLKPSWRGVYEYPTLAAFYEDIFIQPA